MRYGLISILSFLMLLTGCQASNAPGELVFKRHAETDAIQSPP